MIIVNTVPSHARGCRKDGHVAGNCDFRFHDGKIAEEWVSRGELGMLMKLGDKGSKHRHTGPWL